VATSEINPGDPGGERDPVTQPGISESINDPGYAPVGKESYDFTEKEGNPTQHAHLQAELGGVTYTLKFKLSSYVLVAVATMGLVGCCMVFVIKTKNSPYAGWLALGAAVFSLIILWTGYRFARHLMKHEKPGTTEHHLNLRRLTSHDTTTQALSNPKKSKSKIKNSKNPQQRSRRRPPRRS
jgi:hypothetical protein